MLEHEDHGGSPDWTAPQEAREKKPFAPEDGGQYSIEDPNVPERLKREATEKALGAWRKLLADVPDYVVFASTAMYLHGTEHGIDELDVPPGDFDVAVMNKQTLARLAERFGNVDEITLDHDGQPRRFVGEDSMRMSGTLAIPMESDGKEFTLLQPFEFYYNSVIVTPRVLRTIEHARGFRVLGMEGLQAQYGNNLKRELQQQDVIDGKFAFLMEHKDELAAELARRANHADEVPLVPSRRYAEIAQAAGLTPGQLESFFTHAEGLGDADTRIAAEKAIATLLSGSKTKVAKRWHNVEQLQDLQRLET
ncbi:hypothetical protein HYS28_01830 [Candidatus Uhrbacteria bacterium]|nr:hypothetical protein [Candidatus Uhrbacteria bacterium]